MDDVQKKVVEVLKTHGNQAMVDLYDHLPEYATGKCEIDAALGLLKEAGVVHSVGFKETKWGRNIVWAMRL